MQDGSSRGEGRTREAARAILCKAPSPRIGRRGCRPLRALLRSARHLYNARVSTPTSERLEKLRKMLERDPNDTFLLYGVALEHKKLGDSKTAIEYLDRVIAADPGYCYAYH